MGVVAVVVDCHIIERARAKARRRRGQQGDCGMMGVHDRDDRLATPWPFACENYSPELQYLQLLLSHMAFRPGKAHPRCFYAYGGLEAARHARRSVHVTCWGGGTRRQVGGSSLELSFNLHRSRAGAIRISIKLYSSINQSTIRLLSASTQLEDGSILYRGAWLTHGCLWLIAHSHFQGERNHYLRVHQSENFISYSLTPNQ